MKNKKQKSSLQYDSWKRPDDGLPANIAHIDNELKKAITLLEDKYRYRVRLFSTSPGDPTGHSQWCDCERCMEKLYALARTRRSFRFFKITKHFQGGATVFYARLPRKMSVKKGCWQAQLEEWGEGTDGGHNYGYRMYAKQIKRFPPDFADSRFLEFNPHYVEVTKK